MELNLKALGLPTYDEPFNYLFEECIIANIARNINTNDNYWLNFYMHGNGTEWLDFDLPTPSYHEHLTKGYLIAYALDGYFGTKTNQDYLNDIIARFLVTFKDYKPERLPYKPNITPAGTYLPKIHKLQEFQALKSISKEKCPQARADKFDDFVFWAIKFHCESLITTQGMVNFEELFTFALRSFESKEKSTLRAKCRSIWNWYDERDWKIPNRKKYNTEEELKELLMTRQERARANAVKREKESKAKVVNAITGLYANELKKINGTWSIAKIAKFTNLNRDTVSKHLKIWESNTTHTS